MVKKTHKKSQQMHAMSPCKNGTLQGKKEKTFAEQWLCDINRYVTGMAQVARKALHCNNHKRSTYPWLMLCCGFRVQGWAQGCGGPFLSVFRPPDPRQLQTDLAAAQTLTRAGTGIHVI